MSCIFMYVLAQNIKGKQKLENASALTLATVGVASPYRRFFELNICCSAVDLL